MKFIIAFLLQFFKNKKNDVLKHGLSHACVLLLIFSPRYTRFTLNLRSRAVCRSSEDAHLGCDEGPRYLRDFQNTSPLFLFFILVPA